MQNRLFILIAISAIARSLPLLAVEGSEVTPVIKPGGPKISELERLRTENAALKTENAALKAENAQLKADLEEYELILKELAQKVEQLVQKRLQSGADSARDVNLQSKLNELKEAESSLGQPNDAALAKKIPWKKIAKTLRLIADIIDLWAN